MKSFRLLKIILLSLLLSLLGISVICITSYGIYYFINHANNPTSQKPLEPMQSGNISLNEAINMFGESNIENSGDGYVITGYTLPNDVTEVKLPTTINDTPVTYSNQFKSDFREQMWGSNDNRPASRVKYIFIPKLGDEASTYDFLLSKPNIQNNRIIFTNIEEVVLDNQINVLPDSMFAGCKKLTTINIPTKLSEIPHDFLKRTKISELSIPSNISKIGYSAFSGMEALKSVSFSNEINKIEIDSDIFSGCNNLTSINFANINSIINKSSFEQFPLYGPNWWLFKNISTPNQIEITLNQTLHNEFLELINHYRYDATMIRFNVKS